MIPTIKVRCVNCKEERELPLGIHERVTLFICAKTSCGEGQNVVVPVFDSRPKHARRPEPSAGEGR